MDSLISINSVCGELVTVYIPTFNRLALLKRAIASVEAQSYAHIELIVVDDNSSDGTAEYMQSIESKLTVIYLRNEENLGAPSCRNRAIKVATGRFITGLDDDDYFLPARIETLVQSWGTLKRKPAILFTNYLVINQVGKPRQVRGPSSVSRSLLLRGNFIGNQIFTEVSFLREANGFDPELCAWQDYELWLRLLQGCSKAINIPSASYVVDQSHPFERITSSKLSKISDACDLVIHRHSRNLVEATHLRLSYFGYKGTHFGTRELLACFYAGVYLRSMKIFIYKKLGMC